MDDSKVKNKIENEEDVENLQENLEKLYQWTKENNMEFNGKKFQILRYGDIQDIKDPNNF